MSNEILAEQIANGIPPVFWSQARAAKYLGIDRSTFVFHKPKFDPDAYVVQQRDGQDHLIEVYLPDTIRKYKRAREARGRRARGL